MCSRLPRLGSNGDGAPAVGRLIDEAIELADERGGSQAGTGSRSNEAVIQFYQGAEEEAWDALHSILDEAREIRDQQVLTPILGLAVTMAPDAGDVDGALQLADEYNSTAIDVYRAWFLPWVTEPLARLGDADRVASLLDGSPAHGSHGRVGRARSEGHLAVARGDTGEAIDRFLEAAEVADHYGRIFDAALSRIDAARVLAGDERLDDTVAAARRDATQMGAAKLLGQIDEIEGISKAGAARV